MYKSIVSLSVALALTACSPQSSEPTQSTAQQESAASQEKETQQLTSGVIKENMDTSVNPGDDFFNYVNGNWVKELEIPADKSSYGSFTILRDESQDDVMNIIKGSAEGDFKEGSDEQKVGDFYRAYMDNETRDSLGIQPLQPEIEMIDAINDYSDLAAYFAYANRYGYGAPFALGQVPDFRSPETYMIYTWQSGLGLPEKDYYFKDDEASQKIRDAYVKHIENMFTLAGFDKPAENAGMLMDLETKIADMHMKKEDTRDWASNYNKVAVEDMKSVMPDFDWNAFLSQAKLSDLENVVILQTDFMKQLDSLITQTSLDKWKTFLKWNLLNATASRLTTELDQANFEFYANRPQIAARQTGFLCYEVFCRWINPFTAY